MTVYTNRAVLPGSKCVKKSCFIVQQHPEVKHHSPPQTDFVEIELQVIVVAVSPYRYYESGQTWI